MEIKSSPIRNTQETPISEQVDLIMELKMMMKSLLNLKPLSQMMGQI
jgi:hypothetical protein